jgi:putative hydrolase of the HAD superfamily
MNSSGTTKIRTVILDYGEVLCFAPSLQHWSRMADLFGLDPVLFRQIWGKNRLLYDRGDVSYEAYWSDIAEQAKIRLEPRHVEILSPWDVEMWGRINPVMVKWLAGLHSSGIKTGLLSNMPKDMIVHTRRNFPWLKNFDHLTFSAEVRIVKPDPAIYRHSLAGLGATASETLFIDDRATNVEGARAVGLHAIQFHSVDQLKNDLGKLGFSVLPAD